MGKLGEIFVGAAVLQDLQEIAGLESEIFSDPWSCQGIHETWRQKNAFIISARQEEILIGYSIVYYVLDEAEIARIAVRADDRRQGTGHLILQKTIENCRAKGISRLLLDVRAGNDPAVSFYTREGFIRDGIRKDFYDKPKEDAVLMSKVL